MAEAKSPEEPTLPTKRKPDFGLELDPPNKTQKLQLKPTTESEEKINLQKTAGDGETEKPDSNGDGKEADGAKNDDAKGIEEEEVNGVVDRKGKGIMIEEEVDEEGDDDDDDSSEDSDDSDDYGLSDSDSELSDDPLMEVDLDNILPSRTRQRPILPGIYIADDNNKNKEEEDDDSDDPDA